MNELPGNPHYDEANHDGPDGDWRLAQATLALAYEQRTANLIELLRMRVEFAQVGAILEADAIEEIDGRMGLKEAGS